ncbi:TPA: LysE family transporter [Salmonella enterica]|uniref:Lysine transporter LysE n=1 Tax=Salmonella enterica I TaxID=59201 RepID=A0A7Z1PI38_SALET|nr:LysE family transporter [Salmonella enterica]ECG1719782.1 LysE family translocator [Salmonella enterica subsp. diarizonae serovar 17:z10:e,n,x,z15]EAA7556452.1 LysE family translocator [Salmonella enterica]EAA9292628.1 LysE family translocator [Salmonella enterica]EAS2110547.1 LysE family translocator [Salmonella enterica]EAW8685171.1 LysE family translocator [Salmonella enterica]
MTDIGVTMTGLIGLAITSSIIIAIPGPSIMLFIGQVMMDGKSHALRGVLGNAIGMIIIALLLSIGLGSLISESKIALLILRVIGAIALLFIGLQYVKKSTPERKNKLSNKKRPLITGIIVSITNPKSFIMFGTIVPGFLSQKVDNPIVVLLFYSLIPILLGLFIDYLWVSIAHSLKNRALSDSKNIRRISVFGGLLIIITGIILMSESASVFFHMLGLQV